MCLHFCCTWLNDYSFKWMATYVYFFFCEEDLYLFYSLFLCLHFSFKWMAMYRFMFVYLLVKRIFSFFTVHFCCTTKWLQCMYIVLNLRIFCYFIILTYHTNIFTYDFCGPPFMQRTNCWLNMMNVFMIINFLD